MRNKLISLLSLLLIFISCGDSESDSYTLELSKSTFANISANGGIVKVTINSNTEWNINNPTWCVPYKNTGSNNEEITFTISENIEQANRTANIKISAGNISKTLKITQNAKNINVDAIENYNYQIPVIFHVLYKDKNDENQYIKEGRVDEIINACNKLYNNTYGNSVDMKVKFVLATENPDGSILTESGIDRVQVSNPTIDCDKFMKDRTNLNYLWDMDRYINIVLYTFTNKNILGISYLPYTIGPDYLPGLNQLNFLPQLSNLTYPHCISINNQYINTEASIEGRFYNSVDVVATITHELGHYLGLFHAFNESKDEDGNTVTNICEDTDYCQDTPPYNRFEYENELADYQPVKGGNQITFDDLPYLMSRTNCMTNEKTTPNNIMDYEFSYVNRFTNDQSTRIRYVLTHSPLVPGPKLARSKVRTTSTPQEFPKRTIK